MSANENRVIRKLATGVPGLDDVLGGGLPEFSFNIIAGAPGSGKTTLAHQIILANATPEHPALYFTVLGEPALKMLRYQQQFSFFDPSKLNTSIRFINLSRVVLNEDLGAVLDEIVREVEDANPSFVVVDSFRTIARKGADVGGETELQGFIQRLALHLTSWQATTFLIGEYIEWEEMRDNPVFTVSDGLIWLYQHTERNATVRKLQIVKLRGQASVPGLHTLRITDGGVQIFPRDFGLNERSDRRSSGRRLSTGITELDAMMSGGIPEGDNVLVTGASGTGKSLIATQFLAEGIRQGENGLALVFEERPQQYAERAETFGLHLEEARADGRFSIHYLRPLDLSVDEAVREILDTVERMDAKRVVIDSLTGFEITLAPGFREDFRESLYRMMTALAGAGVTVLGTSEAMESFTALPFDPYGMSFLSDDIIRLRYVEIDGQMRRVIVVIKMRGGNHSSDIREYEIGPDGVIIGERLRGYRGLITGVAQPV